MPQHSRSYKVQTISYSGETMIGLWRTSNNLNLKVLMEQKMNSIKIR